MMKYLSLAAMAIGVAVAQPGSMDVSVPHLLPAPAAV